MQYVTPTCNIFINVVVLKTSFDKLILKNSTVIHKRHIPHFGLPPVRDYCHAVPGPKNSEISKHVHVQGGPKKPDCFSDLITLWRLVLEWRAVCQNFRNFIEKKRYITRISMSLNILCQICPNHHNSWNYAIYDRNTWILLNLH